MRQKLPDKHKCVTQRLKIGGQTVHFSVGLFPDGRPGELFIDMHKTGTSVRAWCGSTGKLISLMLQYGIPLSEIVDTLVGHCTEPFGSVPVSGHPMITDAVGVLDAVMRSMALDFLASEGVTKDKPLVVSFVESVDSLDAAEVYELFDEPEQLDRFLEKFIDNNVNC